MLWEKLIIPTTYDLTEDSNVLQLWEGFRSYGNFTT